MFTGIVQGAGTVHRSRMSGLDLDLVVDVGAVAEGAINIGDSISVDGVCLTVIEQAGSDCRFEVSRETLQRTLLGSRLEGDSVNLELAMLPTTRMGGHFVTGHVDGVARLEHMDRVGQSNHMRFSLPVDLSRFVAQKGSICVDGVSLTVNTVSDDWFEVNIISHTSVATTLGRYKVGRKVHLEIDIIARYLERLMNATNEPRRPVQGQPFPELESGGADNAVRDDEVEEITEEFLSKQGFLAPDIAE